MLISNKRVIKKGSRKFERAVETKQHIYFVDFNESDDNGNVIMFDREMNLVSDNYFANVGLTEDLDEKVNITWKSKKMIENLELCK